MIEGAESGLLITGYSLSSYFSKLTDNISNQPEAGKLLHTRVAFSSYTLQQQGRQDGRSARQDHLCGYEITSVNLSYHGQQGNIELGTLIESERTAKQLNEVMTQLIFRKIFEEA